MLGAYILAVVACSRGLQDELAYKYQTMRGGTDEEQGPKLERG